MDRHTGTLPDAGWCEQEFPHSAPSALSVHSSIVVLQVGNFCRWLQYVEGVNRYGATSGVEAKQINIEPTYKTY